MIKSKWLLTMAIAVSMSSSWALAQYQTSPGTDNKANKDTQMTQMRTFDEILKDVNQGKNVGEEEAVMLVQNSRFMTSLEQNPGIADIVARHPYGASLFYEQPSFKRWSDTNPDKAKKVMDAAMKWQAMSAEDKDKFFRKYPTIRSGEMQGGAMDKDTDMQGGGMQEGTTTQMQGGGLEKDTTGPVKMQPRKNKTEDKSTY